jgi:hypothetical protein
MSSICNKTFHPDDSLGVKGRMKVRWKVDIELLIPGTHRTVNFGTFEQQEIHF